LETAIGRHSILILEVLYHHILSLFQILYPADKLPLALASLGLMSASFSGHSLDLGYYMPWQIQIFALAAVLLSGCAGGGSLQAEQAKDQVSPDNPEIADACHIAKTGADRHGVPLPKEALKAIRSELKDKNVDCGKSP
jgi:hypothetical protein